MGLQCICLCCAYYCIYFIVITRWRYLRKAKREEEKISIVLSITYDNKYGRERSFGPSLRLKPHVFFHFAVLKSVTDYK